MAAMESRVQFQETVAYEPVMLNERDAAWLAAFNILPDTPNQARFINTLNELNRQGSTDLRSLPLEASVEHDAIMQARHDFFALVGLSETMAKIASYRPTLFRPESFILLQRELHTLGLNGPGIAKQLSYAVLGRDVTKVKRNFEVLEELGLKPGQVINRFPNILGFAEETLQAKVRYLEELGFKPVQLINRHPTILGLAEKTIQSKIRYLEELGLKVAQVISRHPGVLGLAEKTIQSKIRYLEELGLKPLRIINRCPNILGFSEETIQSKVRCLEELGLEPIQVISRHPDILKLAEETIQSKVRCLEELGFKAQVINRHPGVLGFAEETIQSKVRCLEELGLKPGQVINRFPQILGLSKGTIQSKIRCLEELGLESIQVINHHPSILGLAEKTIQSKFAFFQRTVKLLKWEYTAEVLLNTSPRLLSHSLGKLQIHRRLLARNVISASRNCLPRQIGSASVLPLEAYMIVLADMNEGKEFSLEELACRASRVRRSLAQASRRAEAKTIAESANKTLGSRACKMYLEYAKT